MPLITCQIYPHGTITLDPSTKDLSLQPAYLPTTKENCIALHAAMKSQAENLLHIRPSLIMLTTPHGLRLQDNFLLYGNSKCFGSAEWNGDWKEFTGGFQINTEITGELSQFLKDEGNSVEILQLGSVVDDELKLRWGEIVPFHFISEAYKEVGVTPPPFIVIGIPAKRLINSEKMIPELLKFGGGIAKFVGNRNERFALVTSCDLSHCHSKDHSSPFEFNEDAVPFDQAVVEWAKINVDKTQAEEGGQSHKKLVVEAGSLVDHIKSCGYPGLVVMQGAMTEVVKNEQNVLKARFLEYSPPTYYGMLVAEFILNGI